MVIQGYLISENTDLLEIESQIQKVQKKILNIRQKEYQHLLGKEIAFCCDCIALNILQRPTQGSIADCAVDNLNRRIQVDNYLTFLVLIIFPYFFMYYSSMGRLTCGSTAIILFSRKLFGH